MALSKLSIFNVVHNNDCMNNKYLYNFSRNLRNTSSKSFINNHDNHYVDINKNKNNYSEITTVIDNCNNNKTSSISNVQLETELSRHYHQNSTGTNNKFKITKKGRNGTASTRSSITSLLYRILISLYFAITLNSVIATSDPSIVGHGNTGPVDTISNKETIYNVGETYISNNKGITSSGTSASPISSTIATQSLLQQYSTSTTSTGIGIGKSARNNMGTKSKTKSLRHRQYQYLQQQQQQQQQQLLLQDNQIQHQHDDSSEGQNSPYRFIPDGSDAGTTESTNSGTSRNGSTSTSSDTSTRIVWEDSHSSDDILYFLSSKQNHRVLQEVSSNPLNFLPFWVQYGMIVMLLVLSAMFSGLTLGFLGLDITGLEVVIGSDNVQQAMYAKKVLPIRKYGNLLLCTLIFGNVAVNSLLSILMADKIGGIIGFASSTVLIVIFGEILPQAACARYALAIGSASSPLVKFVVCLFYPIAKPLAIILDYVLGQELLTIYNETEMLKFLQIHVDENAIDKETAATMGGALKYKNLYVKDTMTPIDNVYMISCDDILNFTLLASIFKSGYSRIPIYQLSKHNIVGLLFVKDLIFLDPDDNVRVLDFIEIFCRQINVVWYDDKLGTVLRELKQGKSHMALVRDIVTNDPSNPNLDPYYIIRGIITLEDIIEIILGDDIVDETDLQIVDDSNATNGGMDNIATGGYSKNNKDTGTSTMSDAKSVRPIPITSNNESDTNDNKTTNTMTITKATSMVTMGTTTTGNFNNHNNNRRLDWGRLRSLDSKFVDEVLNDDEVHAIVAHLQKNYSQVFSLINEVQLYKLVSESRVVVYDPSTTDTNANQYQSASVLLTKSSPMEPILPPNKDLILYTKDTVADTSLLILSGKVTIVVGESNFMSDVSSWYLLCPRALQVSSYLPDFTAYVKTVGNQNKCRCLQITKSRYDHAIDASSYVRIGVLETPPTIPETSTISTPLVPTNTTTRPAASSRSLIFSSSSTSSSNLAPASTAIDTADTTITKSTTTKSTLQQQKEQLLAATTLTTKSVEIDSNVSIKSKGSSDSDCRTSLQKFQDALLETTVIESKTQQNTNEVQTKVQDVVTTDAALDPELKEAISHIVTTAMDPNLARDNQPIQENLETKNDFDDKQYDIPDEGTPFDEKDNDKI
jgi:metal transporter CNNM